MRKNKALKTMAAVLSAAFMLSGITAFAQSSDTTANSTETVIEDNRTLTPKGNAQLVDDISDNENLQFITVTVRDGNVFYFVIDKGAESENVYFLNTVDESDLAALVEESDKTKTETVVTPEPTENTAENKLTETDNKDNPTEKNDKKDTAEQRQSNNGFLLVLLLLAGAAGVGVYYFKVVLPKKKLEQADDIEDFEFEEYDEDEETDIEDNEDETEE